MISEELIQAATARLIEAAAPEKIFLFGSFARKQGREHSDLDFMVIQKEIRSRRQEVVRLYDALRPLRVPVDLLLTTETAFREWEDVPGTVFYEVKREGRLCYDASRSGATTASQSRE